MSPEATSSVPKMNLTGFTHMTAILAFCASKPTHVGGAHRM